MIPLQSPTAANNAGPATQAKPAVATSKFENTDFETFLKMLTTQAQNQDPLEPMNASDYASQLATFSSVEQQVKTNEHLLSLQQQLAGDAITSVSRWVGSEIEVEGAVHFDGHPKTISFDPPDTASRAALVISDDAGSEILRQPLAAGDRSFVWSGEAQNGARVPVANYAIHVETLANERLAETKRASSFSEVVEAGFQDGSTMLITATGTKLKAEDVGGFRKRAAE